VVGNWNETVDVVVVGSGGGGMTAALIAKDRGARTLVLEKSACFGGSTAISGGSIWIPNNHLMAKARLRDSTEEGLAYLREITSGRVSEQLLRAYVETAREMVEYLEKNSAVRFALSEGYPDYYPNVSGSKPGGGRTLEPLPIAMRALGAMSEQLRSPSPLLLVLGRWSVTTQEARNFMNSAPLARLETIRRFAGYALNPARSLAKRDTRLTLGNALCAALRRSLADRDVPLWLECAAIRLITEGERVVGLEAQRGGERISIRANQGVIFASGGFDKNRQLRERYHVSGDCANWSSGNPENMGDALRMGIELGAALGNMDGAWWAPTAMVPGYLMPWYAKDAWWTELAHQEGAKLAWFVLVDRSLPGSMIVDASGRRFTNEAASYFDVGHAQIEHQRKGNRAIPAFQIADQRYRRRYPFGPIMPMMPTKKHVHSGFLEKADTIEGLARQCGIDPDGLALEIKRYNENARAGQDPDFKRGATVIDRYYGDPNVKPNPCLAPIDMPPFYAMKIYPGDLGTKGGLRTDTDARVLRDDDTPIEGLYAVGNCAASVMADTYPGAGGTIGPSMTFGYRAARHATGGKEDC